MSLLGEIEESEQEISELKRKLLSVRSRLGAQTKFVKHYRGMAELEKEFKDKFQVVSFAENSKKIALEKRLDVITGERDRLRVNVSEFKMQSINLRKENEELKEDAKSSKEDYEYLECVLKEQHAMNADLADSKNVIGGQLCRSQIETTRLTETIDTLNEMWEMCKSHVKG